ncbi:ATP-binding protein [bacterium]|nr:ATP-binding protein [candidate division CSSED10-310 bacterium]
MGITVATASGKGGTGKTTLAVNLAMVLTAPVTLLDCDVEEPNAHLFIKPESTGSVRFGVPVPRVDRDRCIACGQCARVCRFNAIAVVGGAAVVFPQLCHSCGGCERACPEGAITETSLEVGTIETGTRGGVTLVTGRLDTGISRAEPLVEAVRQRVPGNGIVLVDAPPGNGCPVIAAIRRVDYLLLVAEPTMPGLRDLELGLELARFLTRRTGVVINRSGVDESPIRELCARFQTPILTAIPYDTRIAAAGARAQLVVDAVPEFRDRFVRLWERIEREAKV